MTDPYRAFVSFQEALLRGGIDLRPGVLDPELYVLADKPGGISRLTYVRLEGTTVTALVTVVHADRMEGWPCLHLGYAVAEPYRRQGRATEAVQAALTELLLAYARAGVPGFYVEAIVGIENEGANGVARRTLSPTPEPVVNSVSGESALHYLRKFETSPSIP